MAEKVTATWTDPSPTTNVDKLELWRKLDGGVYSKISGIALGVETYDDETGVTEGLKYFYEIRAFNIDGNFSSIEANITITSGTDVDYQALLDRGTFLGYSLPSSGQQIIQNQLVVDLKADGIWSKLDLFYVFATDGDRDFAKLNWAVPASFELSEFNTPLFTTDVGFKGNGTNMRMETGWNPSTELNNYLVNDRSHGAYIVQGTIRYAYGHLMASSLNASFIQATASEIRTNINSNVTDTKSLPAFYSISDNSTSLTGYRNGTSFNTGTGSSNLPNLAFNVLCLNNNGSPNNFGDLELGVMYTGAHLTATEMGDFNTAIQTYITGI